MPMTLHTDTSLPAQPARRLDQALFRGLAKKCPACGRGNIYRAFLKVNDHCPSCGEALYHQRADDAPPYFVMLIVGHIIVAGVLSVEQIFAPPEWVHLALWLPMTVALSLALLPHVKGALIAIQWAHRMHGFGDTAEEAL